MHPSVFRGGRYRFSRAGAAEGQRYLAAGLAKGTSVATSSEKNHCSISCSIMEAFKQSRLAVVAVWLVYLVATVDARSLRASEQTDSCPEQADPVCGLDGITYYNECLAKLQQVQVQHAGYCKESFFSFTGASDSLSVQLESAVSPSAAMRSNSNKLLRRMGLRKERATAMLSADVINAFSADGFVYVGRAELSKRPKASEKAPAAASGGLLPSYVSAVRFTPQGHVYVQKQQDFTQELMWDSVDEAIIPPQIPATATADNETVHFSTRHLHQQGRHLNILVGSDDRKICPQGPVYPYTAIGQIDFSEAGTPYICSGALISARRVLTAAHCVWDVDTQSFVDMLSFAPGRYRAGGQMVNPFGVMKWSHATLMKNYISSQETQGDIAVIQLETAAPKQAGTLGLKSQCVDESNVMLTTAGYPSDKPEGECDMATCEVSFNCNRESTRHTCDTYMGQSGSSFWDSHYYVRGVHVRGLIDENVNEFTTVSRRIIGKIRDWESRESGGVF